MGTPICKPANPSGVEYQEPSNGEENGTSITSLSNANHINTINNNNGVTSNFNTLDIRSSLKTKQMISQNIDRSISKQRKEEMSRMKILLLGGADAGKSTIVKQMRILHMSGFTEDELTAFKKYLRYNLFQIFHIIAMGIQECLPHISEFEIGLIEKFSENLTWIIEIDVEAEIDILRMFGSLECVTKFLEKYPNYPSLPDNTHYYVPLHLDRILQSDFTPNEDDILHLRIPTSNINEINFSFSTCTIRSLEIRLIDVGGQKTYRKKWIHCFEGVAAVLFVASMAAYDQTLEDVDASTAPVLYKEIFGPKAPQKITNRLRDSAHLFGEMLRNTFLKTSAFILFLNKKDLFTKKLSTSRLADFLHNYDKANEYEPAAEFLKAYFLKRKSKKDRDRKIYSHFTCATDTKNVEFVFKATCDIVLQKNLNSSGIQ